MSHGKFATAVNCMDGRVQLPVIEWMKRELGADFIDMVTEPGPIRVFAENTDEAVVASVRKRVRVSVEKHGSGAIAIVGHFDCAGNPVAKETQLEQIRKSLLLIRSWGFAAEVIGLWVDEKWQVERLQF